MRPSKVGSSHNGFIYKQATYSVTIKFQSALLPLATPNFLGDARFAMREVFPFDSSILLETRADFFISLDKSTNTSLIKNIVDHFFEIIRTFLDLIC